MYQKNFFNDLFYRREDNGKMILVVKDKNIGCKPHFHDNIELIYFLNGHHTATINGEQVTMTADDIVFCNAFDTHEYTSVDNGELILLTFSKSYFEDFESYYPNEKFENFMTNKVVNRRVFDLFPILLQNYKDMNILQKKGYINMILGELVSNYPPSKARQNNNEITKILNYINENCAAPLTRDMLAAHFGYSNNYFSTMFNKSMQLSLKYYINLIRLRQAIKLIRQDVNCNHTILDISLNVGFDSTCTFYRVYKQHTNEKFNRKNILELDTY